MSGYMLKTSEKSGNETMLLNFRFIENKKRLNLVVLLDFSSVPPSPHNSHSLLLSECECTDLETEVQNKVKTIVFTTKFLGLEAVTFRCVWLC